jgi:hypothetical protein
VGRYSRFFGSSASVASCTIPLMTRRSLTCSTPRTSVGKCGSIRAHCASLSQNKFLCVIPIPFQTNAGSPLGFEGEVLDVAGNAGAKSPQVAMALERIRSDETIAAIYGFAGGGYNARLIWKELTAAERERIRKVIVIGSPQVTEADFPGKSDILIWADPPEGHMAGPRVLLEFGRSAAEGGKHRWLSTAAVHSISPSARASSDHLRTQSPVATASGAAHFAPSVAPLAETKETSSSARRARGTLRAWSGLAASGNAKCRYHRANAQDLPHRLATSIIHHSA